LASIFTATSPPRWMIPRTGGFSFSSVPRPRAAFSLLRRPARRFFDGGGVSLVARVDVDLVDLDLARQHDGRNLGREPLAQMRRHLLNVALVQAQFMGDLAVRKVQPHEIQTQHPDLQRLMMPGQYRIGEIVEANCAVAADIALTKPLRIVVAVAQDMSATALGTPHALRPTHLANEFETFGFVEQAREIDEGDQDSNL
jgi:hypothetical protein